MWDIPQPQLPVAIQQFSVTSENAKMWQPFYTEHIL